MKGLGRRKAWLPLTATRLVATARRVSAMQREELVASTRFLAAQFHEWWSWSAAVGVGQKRTRSGFLTTLSHACWGSANQELWDASIRTKDSVPLIHGQWMTAILDDVRKTVGR